MNTVINDQSFTPRVVAALNKLERIRAYADGWAFGEGKAFSSQVYEMAVLLVLSSSGYPGGLNVDVFPGRNGSITVTVYRGADSYNFIVSSTRVDVMVENGDGDERDVSFSDAVTDLSKKLPVADPVLDTRIAPPQWTSFESFTPIITSQPKIAFVAKPSSPTSIWGIFRSSKRSAPFVLPGTLVAT